MAKVVVKSKAKKIKRKFPVKIVAPEYLNSTELGSSQVTDLTSMVGKRAKVNLMYVTGNIKNQNIRLTFKVIEVSSGLANTTVAIYEQIPYYLSRYLKAGSDLVEDSIIVKSKDGFNIRIKPFIVTKMNSSKNTLTSMRAKTREVIANEAMSKTYDEFISAIISGKLQNVFRNEVKTIFPVKTFEFRKVELLN